jgi:single-stranded DNA-binding protein
MNSIKVSGLVSGIEFSHFCKDDKFFKFNIECMRKSGVVDILPCIVLSAVMEGLKNGEKAEVVGEIRSRNLIREDGSKGCDVFIFVKNVNQYGGADVNEAALYGIICKQPKYKITPKGKEVAETIVASKRPFVTRTDYIPILAWGRSAKILSEMSVSDAVSIGARFQSRSYGVTENGGKITFELSCFRFWDAKDQQIANNVLCGEEAGNESNNNNDI